MTTGMSAFALGSLKGVGASTKYKNDKEKIKSKWEDWEGEYGDFVGYEGFSYEENKEVEKWSQKCKFSDGTRKQLVYSTKDRVKMKIRMGDEKYQYKFRKSKQKKIREEMKEKEPQRKRGGK